MSSLKDLCWSNTYSIILLKKLFGQDIQIINNVIYLEGKKLTIDDKILLSYNSKNYDLMNKNNDYEILDFFYNRKQNDYLIRNFVTKTNIIIKTFYEDKIVFDRNNEVLFTGNYDKNYDMWYNICKCICQYIKIMEE